MVPRDEVLEILFGVLPRLVRAFLNFLYMNTLRQLIPVRMLLYQDLSRNKISQLIDRTFSDIIHTVSPGCMCLAPGVKRS